MTDSSGISGRRLSSMWSRLRDRGPSRTAFTGAASVTASTRLSSPVPRSPSFDRTAAFFDVDNTLMRGARSTTSPADWQHGSSSPPAT